MTDTNIFNWDKNQDQTYSEKYGSQESAGNTSDFSKNDGKSFTMDAGSSNMYTIKPSNNTGATNWHESSLIEVKSGDLTLDFSGVAPDGWFEIGETTISGGSLTVKDVGDFNVYKNITIENNGVLLVDNFKGSVVFSDTSLESIVRLKNNATLSIISAPENDDEHQFVSHFELVNQSATKLAMSSMNHISDSLYKVQDNATFCISSDEISSETSLQFELGAGKSQISIKGFNSELCNITKLGLGKRTTPKGRFNFVTKDANDNPVKNNGELILSCFYTDADGEIITDPNLIKRWMATMNLMLCIDGEPKTVAHFDIDTSDNKLVIKLKQ